MSEILDFLSKRRSVTAKRMSEGNVLKEHLQRHTGIKPFGCPLCDTKFYRKTEQKQHFAAVHDKVRPINCLYCPKTFSRKYHLKTHLKSHNIIS